MTTAVGTRSEDAPAATLPILSHWINGGPVEVLPEQTGPVFNPATGDVVARVPRGPFGHGYMYSMPSPERCCRCVETRK